MDWNLPTSRLEFAPFGAEQGASNKTKSNLMNHLQMRSSFAKKSIKKSLKSNKKHDEVGDDNNNLYIGIHNVLSYESCYVNINVFKHCFAE